MGDPVITDSSGNPNGGTNQGQVLDGAGSSKNGGTPSSHANGIITPL